MNTVKENCGTIDFKTRQIISLDILREIDSFCKNNSIIYYIAYGTLLGAVRHSGFIPWDDDIDLIMFRDDYERFIRLFNAECNNPSLTCLSFEMGSFYLPFAKVVNRNTHVIQKDFIPLESNGVAVDIFPFDRVSDDVDVCEHQKKKFRIYGKLLRYSLYNNRTEITKRLSFKHLLFCVAKLLGHKRIRKMMMKKGFFISDENKQYCFSYGAYLCGDPGVYDINWFYPPTELSFEGKKFQAISNYDKFLKTRYGDYMKLPPKEEQIQHNVEAYYVK